MRLKIKLYNRAVPTWLCKRYANRRNFDADKNESGNAKKILPFDTYVPYTKGSFFVGKQVTFWLLSRSGPRSVRRRPPRGSILETCHQAQYLVVQERIHVLGPHVVQMIEFGMRHSEFADRIAQLLVQFMHVLRENNRCDVSAAKTRDAIRTTLYIHRSIWLERLEYFSGYIRSFQKVFNI